ncbi:hypothetical protein BH10PSE17_BH10PSE17_28100 [soil metagenome]
MNWRHRVDTELTASHYQQKPNALVALLGTTLKSGFVGGALATMAAYYFGDVALLKGTLVIGLPVAWVSAFVMVARHVRVIESQFAADAVRKAAEVVEPVYEAPVAVQAAEPVAVPVWNFADPASVGLSSSNPASEVLATVPQLLRTMAVKSINNESQG